VKQQAKDMANQTKERGKTMLEQQKGAAAGQVDSVAHALRTTAGQLQGEGQQRTGDYVGMIADQLETTARQLKEKNLDELMRDVQNVARRSPATFIAGSVAVGFLLARFLKSSSEHQEEGRSAYSGTGRSGYAPHNIDGADSTGLGSVADDNFRTGSTGFSSGSNSAAMDAERDTARFPSASASPLTESAIPSYPPADTNAADSASSSGTASTPSTTSNLGGNSYGNR
jgi:hypothetical protein